MGPGGGYMKNGVFYCLKIDMRKILIPDKIRTFNYKEKGNRVFVINSDFLILLSLQPNVVSSLDISIPCARSNTWVRNIIGLSSGFKDIGSIKFELVTKTQFLKRTNLCLLNLESLIKFLLLGVELSAKSWEPWEEPGWLNPAPVPPGVGTAWRNWAGA